MKVTKWNVASNLLRQWALGRHHCKAQSPYLCSQLFAGHKLCKVLLHAHIIDNTFSQLQSVQNCNPHKLIDISPKLNTVKYCSRLKIVIHTVIMAPASLWHLIDSWTTRCQENSSFMTIRSTEFLYGMEHNKKYYNVIHCRQNLELTFPQGRV